MTRFVKPVTTKAMIALALLSLAGVVTISSASFNLAQLRPPLAGQAEEVYVPAGPFPMGCAEDVSISCDGDSKPVHQVYLDAFYIDKTEVTNAHYAACVAAGACPEPLSLESPTRPDYHTNPAYANHPVVHIDWDRANTYCRWLGKRLPTEAEWEKTARGLDVRRYPWGYELPTCERANFLGCHPDTVAVGSYPNAASPYGALDMAGNVSEWVNDFYVRHYYQESPYYNPRGPDVDPGKWHLIRGGSWAEDAGGLTTHIRLDESEVYKVYRIGFRCARNGPVPPPPSPTPTPTPTPLPQPVSAIVGSEGRALWQAYPGHLTLLEIPPDSVTGSVASALFTLRYDKRPNNQGDLQGLDHFFSIEENNAFLAAGTALSVTMAYLDHGGTIQDSLDVYRLEAGRWVTEGIRLTGRLPGALSAQVDRPGAYGLLGRTHRTYLPVVHKR